MISSDGSANCGDSAYTSWDFDVVCAFVLNPTVTFNVVPDCANSQYSIEVDVTNIGSATSLTISDGTFRFNWYFCNWCSNFRTLC